ncbi:pentapeptide repeat-containing protein [Orrella dioscoreae]|uniref:Pentapeptide repeat family protein n=1 Tax=Orrella dioscoreae TaxID=1851544 RepID=A0A1C3K1B9_9BURK|nr:pentapeptide repeat-containing protein [Orrella dioscoreae]SBT25313.1 pentapeptide repeat family protein [Orrella dioscoreae]SOE49095.1 pentapeptide repeat family protein [Orrella dioscoreae]
MKHQIKNRFTGAVLFEADVPEGTESGIIARVALEQSVAAGANLRDANLGGADLRDANLGGADLRGANLRGANLGGADLRDANLGGADLRGANLRGANLGGADLRDANLGGADLRGANLRGANLGGADLRDANLGGADLGGADLGGANLGELGSIWDTAGNRAEIKSLQLETWGVTYTATHMQIGCQHHTLERWWGFSDDCIRRMDERALEWWRKWKPVIQQIVAMSPAVPGGAKPAEPVEQPAESEEA